MQRIYENSLIDHINNFNQMIFLAGPRQVGKTTIGHNIGTHFEQTLYLSWEIKEIQQQIFEGQMSLGNLYGLDKLSSTIKLIIFDELHKYKKWKNFLKGFFDLYKERTKIIVTGSAKLNIYQRSQDSLMGRYFLYRIHPISVAECVRSKLSETEISTPQAIDLSQFHALLDFGGYPEPFLKQNKQFSQRWRMLWNQQLFREDIRDLSHIHDITNLELLANLLKTQVGQLFNKNSLAKKMQISAPTIAKWISSLENIYYCFQLKPWTKNISRSLIKQPKLYLYDWSNIEELGAKHENFVACHLFKAVQFWTDIGLGVYDLYFLRDKEQREIDFLVVKNKKPWFLVEVKSSSKQPLSSPLNYYHQLLQTQHAFQVVFDLPYIDRDCFSFNDPIIVPAQTFLSQLI